MAIQLNGGVSLAPTQTRRIDGRSYNIPLITEQPATQADIFEATKTYTSPKTIESIDPLSLVGFGAPGGLSPTGVMNLWQLAFGSAETQQEISLGMVAGATPYVEPFGIVPAGTTQDILDIPIVDFPGSDVPGLPALDVVLPGAGDFLGSLDLKLPDLGGIKNALIIGAVAIAGILILPHLLKGFKK